MDIGTKNSSTKKPSIRFLMSPPTLKVLASNEMALVICRDCIRRREVDEEDEWDFWNFHLFIEDVESFVPEGIPELTRMVQNRLHNPVARSIDQWYAHHKTYVFFDGDLFAVMPELIDYFMLKPDGTISFLQTAKNLIISDKLNVVEKFRLACLNCMVDDIERLLHSIPADQVLKERTYDEKHAMTRYWISCKGKGNLQRPTSALYHPTLERMEMTTIEYFWSSLSEDAQVKKLHCCRSRNHWRCFSDDRSRVLASFVPRRHLTQDVNERVPSSGTGPPETAGTEEKKKEDQITIDYYRGLPRITVPLPSRNEKCRFTLKPISNTVGDLTSMIQQEDRGIDRVVLSTKDGVKIASSCSIEILLQEEEIYVTINDKRYHIKIPTAIRKSFTKDDLDKLSDVRILISQLYETLNVKEYHVHKEQELLAKLEKIQSSLQPLEEQRALLEKKAGYRTSVLTWVGLSMMGVQFGILARLTWWEYSWDIMEPVTYFVTYGTAMATYAYFALTKQDYILPEIRDRQHLIALHKKANKLGFDLKQYNTLRDQLAIVKTDLDRLRDPLIPPQKFSKAYPHHSELTDEELTRHQSALDQIKTYMTAILNKTKKL